MNTKWLPGTICCCGVAGKPDATASALRGALSKVSLCGRYSSTGMRMAEKLGARRTSAVRERSLSESRVSQTGDMSRTRL
jgi:hypothetical protein